MSSSFVQSLYSVLACAHDVSGNAYCSTHHSSDCFHVQAKKVIRTIEAETHSGSNDGGSSHAEEIAHLERENAQLKGEIADIKARIQRSQGSQAPPAPAPVAHAPAPSPPPQQHHQQQSRGPGVVGGAARGALGGAAKGAIAGAILPGMSAADGAAAGAAVGAATGGARGLRGRLRR